MKKLILLNLLLAAMVSFLACNSSVKGNWSDADKKKAREEIKSIESDLEILGEYKDAYIECYLKKVEDNYDSFDDANVDEEGCEKLATECAEEVMGADMTEPGTDDPQPE